MRMDKELLYDKKRVNMLFLMLAILPINDIVSTILYTFNVNMSRITIMLYFIVIVIGIFTLIRCPIYKSDILSLLIIFFIYTFLYFVSTDYAKKEFFTTNMRIIYFYYIPFSIFFISHIKRWDILFTEKKFIVISDMILIISFLTRTLNDTIDYMVFSYNILPLCGIIAVTIIKFENKRQIIFIILSIVELMLFGSRGALIWLLICGMLLYLSTFIRSFNSKKEFYKKIISITLVFIASLFFITYIIPKAVQSSFGNTSYILRRIKGGNVTESEARLSIYKTSLEHIKNNGININGLFYDRTVLPKNMYAHNLVLESYLSFGLLFGTFILLAFIYMILRTIKKSHNIYSYATIYFITIFLLRYFVSGSAFSEGKFIIFIAFLYSIICNKQLSNNIKAE